MAGQPKRRAEMVMLAGHEEQIFEWLEDGRTQGEIAAELGCMRTSLTRWLNANAERKQTLVDSRTLAADLKAEEGLEIADASAGLDSAGVQAAKLRIDTRLRIAAIWNPARYAAERAGGVTINIGSLHLDALRQAQAAGGGAVQAIEHAPAAIGVAGLYPSEAGIVDVQASMLCVDGDEYGLM